MRQSRLKSLILILLTLGWMCMHAQQIHETIPATGGNAIGNGGSASYSIGQVFCSFSSDTNGSVLQGVQQPYEISVFYGIAEATETNLMVFAHPNPVKDKLTLNVVNLAISDLSVQLFDFSGKLLSDQKITNIEYTLDFCTFSPAIYFLKVIKAGKEIKTFKIIKNQ